MPPLTGHGAGTAATGTLTTTPSLTATPCAAQQQPLAVAVVLDRSGTMRGAPLSAAKTGAQTLLDTLDLAVDHLAVIRFATGSRIDAPLSQDRALLQAAIAGMTVGGKTDIVDGIQMAHAELTRERRTPGVGMVMVVLSDGQKPIAAVLPAATAAQADGIRLISIGLGRTNAETMQAIASSPDDDDQTPTADALVAIFATIGGTLCGSRPTLTPSLTPEPTATPSVTRTPDPDARATPTPTVTATVTPTPAPPIGALVMPGWIAQSLHQGAVTSVVAITLAADVTLVDGTLDDWPAADPRTITTLATGLTGQGGALLATVDTTLLTNDSDIVRLTGTNAQGVTQASGVLVTVAGSYKPGRVRFEVTDLTVPVAGMPITVGRTYDSLERTRVGDFGYGWSLSLGNPRLTVDPAHHVTLTMPNGERVTFHVTPRSYGGLFGALLQPAYTPEAGVYGTLTADGCPILVAGGSGYLCFLARPQYAPVVGSVNFMGNHPHLNGYFGENWRQESRLGSSSDPLVMHPLADPPYPFYLDYANDDESHDAIGAPFGHTPGADSSCKAGQSA